MTPLRHSASPAVSGIAGAVSPGVQAAVAGSSPAKFRPSDFALGGVDKTRGETNWPGHIPAALGRVMPPRAPASGSRCNSGPSAPFNDCGGVDSDTRPDDMTSRRAGLKSLLKTPCTGSSRCNSDPQSLICPELTAYITTLLAVVGAIAWAHVFAMQSTLVGELINFHPRVMFCDAVGTKADFVCAVRHKEGE